MRGRDLLKLAQNLTGSGDAGTEILALLFYVLSFMSCFFFNTGNPTMPWLEFFKL